MLDTGTSENTESRSNPQEIRKYNRQGISLMHKRGSSTMAVPVRKYYEKTLTLIPFEPHLTVKIVIVTIMTKISWDDADLIWIYKLLLYTARLS